MSRAVDALVKKRLVTRVEDPDDRRVRRVAITAKGKELVDTLLSRPPGRACESLRREPHRGRSGASSTPPSSSLMDREDIAQTYEHLKEVRAA